MVLEGRRRGPYNASWGLGTMIIVFKSCRGWLVAFGHLLANDDLGPTTSAASSLAGYS
jgi:hypothetical protein